MYLITVFIYKYVIFEAKLIAMHLDALSRVSLLWYFNNTGFLTVMLLLSLIERYMSSSYAFIFSYIFFELSGILFPYLLVS